MWLQNLIGSSLVATNLDVTIRLRLDAATKELWVAAAGGERKLSEWIRGRCNAALTERERYSAETSGEATPTGLLPPRGGVAKAPSSRSASASFRGPDPKPGPKLKK